MTRTRRTTQRSRLAVSALSGCATALSFALIALVMAASPARSQGAVQQWCARIPLPERGRAAAACRPLEIRTPHATLRLAVAATEGQRERGLMNVRWVPPGQGMIFVFPEGDAQRGFWMKDTVTPLDMVFVTEDGTISDVAVNVPATPPHTPDAKVARRNGLAHYVLELGAGQAGPLGLLPGTRIVIPPVAAR